MSLTPEQLVACALDPSQILRAQGINPDPWQQQLLLSTHPYILLNCSRQSGKSTTVAALALHVALFEPKSLVLLLCPALRQSLELFRKVADANNALGCPIPADTDNATSLEFQNKSRILTIPAREDTIRSFSSVTLLLIDEAARVPDDLYQTVRPMLAVSRGRLICLSTPMGQHGFFWREWQDKAGPWQRTQIPWQECPRISADFIAAETRSLGESWVRQEYGCSFESLEGLVYPDFESRCGVSLSASASQAASTAGVSPDPASRAASAAGLCSTPASAAGLSSTSPSQAASAVVSIPPRVGGLDFGYRNPFAALWGHVDHDGTLWLTGEHYESGKLVLDHAAHIPRKVMWHADPSGAQEIATLTRLDFKVRRAHNDIAAGIAAVQARIETGRLKVVIERCPNLLREARLYRYSARKDQGSANEVPVDEHNHALAALRYLVSCLDDSFIRKYRRQQLQDLQPGRDQTPPTQTPAPTSPPPRHRMNWRDESLWSPIYFFDKRSE